MCVDGDYVDKKIKCPCTTKQLFLKSTNIYNITDFYPYQESVIH